MSVTGTRYFDMQRKMVAGKTSESWRTVPHAAYLYEPDITDFYAAFQKLSREKKDDYPITFNIVMLKAISEGLKAAPVLNSHFEYNEFLVRGKIITYDSVDVSMPVITPGGKMMTLNLHDCGNRDLRSLSEGMRDLMRRMRKSDLTEAMFRISVDDTLKKLKKGRLFQAIGRLWGAYFGLCKVRRSPRKKRKAFWALPETERLTMKDLELGTLTVSNIGSVLPKQQGAPLLLEIVPPQVCAICIGAPQDKAFAVCGADGQGTVKAGKTVPIAIAVDHRALDFGDAMSFLRRMDEVFAHPEILSEWA